MILGVDRLDYTKGLVARMRALNRMLEKHPKWIGKVSFIQVTMAAMRNNKRMSGQTFVSILGRYFIRKEQGIENNLLQFL